MNGAILGGGVLFGLLALLAGGAAMSSGGASAPQVPPAPTGPTPSRPSSTATPRDSRATPSRSHPVPGPVPAPEPVEVSMAHARRISWAILSVFESSSPQGQYSAFAVLRDQAGISYGIKQGTDRSGTLDRICLDYIEQGGQHAEQLRPFMPRLERDETTLMSTKESEWPAWMHELKRVLVAAGSDPVMQRVQDHVFDVLYWRPAVNAWGELGLRTPLALAVVFDTCIHSGGPHALNWVRRRFRAKPPVDGGNEREWIRQYVRARRAWLANHRNDELHVTVYRMDAFLSLIEAGNWGLQTPIHIRQSRTPIV